jgi:peroxiredoxin
LILPLFFDALTRFRKEFRVRSLRPPSGATPSLRRGVAIGTMILCWLLLLHPAAAAERVKIDAPAPDFTLPLLTGGELSLSSLKGKVVLLTFWAVWCHACAEELPVLEAIYLKYRDRGLEVVGVNIDRDPPDSIQRYVQKKGISFPILLDRDKKAMRTYQAHFLPTTFLLDRKGVVVERKVGAYNWTSPPGRVIVEELLRR